MKNKLRVIFILLIIGGIGCRILWVNLRWPVPQMWTGEQGDSLMVGNYRITFSDWSWSDGTLLQKLCPGLCLIADEGGEEYPVHRERVGLITLRLEKMQADESILDLTGIAFESGAWGNGYDMELMYLLNPQLEGLHLRMEEGECREIIFPMTMSDLQFGERAWERIDERDFYMVLEYYPRKLRFRCGHSNTFRLSDKAVCFGALGN